MGGGSGHSTTVQLARVLFLLEFFTGDAEGFFLLMYARVHTCACVCGIVLLRVRLPLPSDFLNLYSFPCFFAS